ncbi:MAG: TonB-dependent receptor, partial [Bacteroidales bacterium]
MTYRKHRLLFLSLVMALLLGVSPNIYAQTAGRSNTTAEKNNFVIKGIVKDDAGEPLPGVSVSIKSTTAGTITDINGNFALECAPKATLVFSYIGYTTQERTPDGKKNLSVILSENNKLLDEVIVIGYGTTTRKSAVGSVDQVKSEMIENRPVANLTQALQGAAPNLVIQQRSFNPNDNTSNLNIRGVSTLNSNSPLIVIDGLVSDESSFNKLNPMDIGNISILKDAGTAAIYGSRSSNGVILVTTKTGQKEQAPSIRLSGMMGWQDPKILFSPVAGYQNATLRNLAMTNANENPVYTPDQIRDLAAHRNEENWFYNQIIRTALQQNYNLSVSGGNKNTTYLFSLGYYDQESNYVGNRNYGIERYNLRSNITTEKGRFKLTFISSFTRNNSVSPAGGSLEIDASRIPPYYYYQMKTEDGKYLINDILSEFNPLGLLEAGGTNKYRNNYFNGNIGLDIKIIDGLKLRGILGVDVMNDHRFTRNNQVPFYTSADAETPSSYANATRETGDWNYDAYRINSQLLMDYNKSFGKHNITGLLGATNESFTSTGNEIKMKYTEPELGTSGGDDTEIVVGGGSSVSIENTNRWSITSVLGRAGYNFADKYYAEFSFRYDGSSKFAKEQRWGFFPSGSVGWRISEESFMERYKEKIGDIKLRGSYGILGNQSIGTYDRFTIYSNHNNSYAYDNIPVTGVGFDLGNKNLTWEKTYTADIGIDAGFLNNSLNVTFDYFHKKTTDILMKPIVPTVFGTTMPMDNIGEMQNQGWDLSINYRLKSGKFMHNVNFSLGDSWNKVLKFPGKEQINGLEELNTLIREGAPLNSYYGYKTAGLFQSYDEIETSAIPVGGNVQPGDLKFVDRNEDGVIDSKDRYILGNAFPRFTFGLTYSVSYRNFD